VFCERLPAVLAAHARSTGRLTDTHRAIGFALGGEAGARLCEHLAVPTSPDTLLRRVKAAATAEGPAPRVLGVDDFAFRKGRTYGTILVDLERRRVVDLLPDRTADALADWLRRHPGVEIVSRDRASAYAEAAAAAAPGATQVADRWHLLGNLRETVERLAQERTAALRAPAAPAAAPDDVTPLPRAPAAPAAADPTGDRRRRVFEQVRGLHQGGMSLRRIARELGLHYRTVVRYVRSDACPDWNAGRPRPSALDAHATFIRQRLRDGHRTAAQISRELAARGYRGAASVVRGYVRRVKADLGLPAARPSRPLAAPRPVPPSARRLAVAVIRRPADRSADEAHLVGQLRDLDPDTGTTVGLAESFAALVRDRTADGLGDWLERAEAVPRLRPFARGLRRDEAAVRAALSLPWSNGQVEGQVNRLKLIKRAGYGRAGFALLKARVLHAA
jgi:transposase